MFIKRFFNKVNTLLEAKSKINKMDRKQLKKYYNTLKLVESRGDLSWDRKMIINHTKSRIKQMGY